MAIGVKQYQDTIDYISKLYDYFNEKLFYGELEKPVITISPDEKNLSPNDLCTTWSQIFSVALISLLMTIVTKTIYLVLSVRYFIHWTSLGPLSLRTSWMRAVKILIYSYLRGFFQNKRSRNTYFLSCSCFFSIISSANISIDHQTTETNNHGSSKNKCRQNIAPFPQGTSAQSGCHKRRYASKRADHQPNHGLHVC